MLLQKYCFLLISYFMVALSFASFIINNQEVNG
jgi:hypothetical protein